MVISYISKLQMMESERHSRSVDEESQLKFADDLDEPLGSVVAKDEIQPDLGTQDSNVSLGEDRMARHSMPQANSFVGDMADRDMRIINHLAKQRRQH